MIHSEYDELKTVFPKWHWPLNKYERYIDSNISHTQLQSIIFGYIRLECMSIASELMADIRFCKLNMTIIKHDKIKLRFFRLVIATTILNSAE